MTRGRKPGQKSKFSGLTGVDLEIARILDPLLKDLEKIENRIKRLEELKAEKEQSIMKTEHALKKSFDLE